MRLRSIVLGALGALALGLCVERAAIGADPIKVGLLEDVSGDLALFGKPKLNGSLLAVEEINKAGGIMGRQIELIHLDPQGDNARYQEFARRLVSKDKVDVLIGGITSASREAIRPIMDRTDTLYIYTNQYEGGVCDAGMISNGAVPEQQFSTLIPYMVATYGKKVYTIAADYNFGQISAEWNRKLVKEQGGTVVGEEFIPLGVSQFAQTIQNIQKAKPDWLLTINVGAAQDSFFEQAAAAKLGLPMGSSIKVMLGFEHKRFAPPALYRMNAVANRGPKAKRALGRLRATGQGYIDFALAEPGLFRTAFGHSGVGRGGHTRQAEGAETQIKSHHPFQILIGCIDDLVAVGVISADRRDGLDEAVWAAVHGLSTLFLDGSLSEADAHRKQLISDRLLDVIGGGLQ